MFDNVARANLGLRLGLNPKSTLSSILDRTKVGMTLVPLGVAEFPDLSSMDLDRI